jgi:hypothetical protein
VNVLGVTGRAQLVQHPNHRPAVDPPPARPDPGHQLVRGEPVRCGVRPEGRNPATRAPWVDLLPQKAKDRCQAPPDEEKPTALNNITQGVGAMKRITLPLVVLVIAIAAGASIAAPASAAAIVIRDTITTPFTESGVPNDCRPGVTGSLEGTSVFDFQSIETEEGFHVTGTFTDSIRIDWSDGTYAIGESTEHVAFNAVENGTTVFTLAHQDSANTYSADGAFLYGLTFHLVEHVTVTNGDVTRVEFERGRLHTVGDC